MPDEPKIPSIPPVPQFFQSSGQAGSYSPEIWEQKLAELKAMPEYAEQAKIWETIYAALKQRNEEVIAALPAPIEVEKEPTIRDAFREGRKEVQAMMERIAHPDQKD